MPAQKDILRHQVKLLSLELNDFRGFRFLNVSLDTKKPITILIADNGGGKSTILDSIADFLGYFLHTAIFGKNDTYQTMFTEIDITNGEAASLCKMNLELTYPYPAVELFEICNEITEYLNEYKIHGGKAIVRVPEDAEQLGYTGEWQLFIDNSDSVNDLPEEIINKLNALLIDIDEDGKAIPVKLSSKDIIHVADNVRYGWAPNLQLASTDITKVSYTGQLAIVFELNKNGGTYSPSTPDSNGNKINALKDRIASLEDFKQSAEGYVQNDGLTILPLLSYYGGSAINTQIDSVSILYRQKLFHAYTNALHRNRFDFSDFFAWFYSWNEDSSLIKKNVADKILEVLNADEHLYTNLRIEKGGLLLDKKYSGSVPIPIEINQLSAGEKNLFALIGDLIKRSAQLNPVLFEMDMDRQDGLSDLFENTEGIVLVDEIDLHMHPKWQRQIIPKLKGVFPRIQFIVTTHSPFVLQLVDNEYQALKNEEGNYKALRYEDIRGWTIEEVLSDVMGLDSKIFTDKSNHLIAAIEKALENNDYHFANENYKKLLPMLHPESTIIKLLRMQIEAIKEN